MFCLLGMLTRLQHGQVKQLATVKHHVSLPLENACNLNLLMSLMESSWEDHSH